MCKGTETPADLCWGECVTCKKSRWHCVTSRGQHKLKRVNGGVVEYSLDLDYDGTLK